MTTDSSSDRNDSDDDVVVVVVVLGMLLDRNRDVESQRHHAVDGVEPIRHVDVIITPWVVGLLPFPQCVPVSNGSMTMLLDFVVDPVSSLVRLGL